MYETYVPIRVERKPPTIAEIVRQKTDDGARIIDFFLDVMEGRVDGAMLCHRIDAAKQLVKYGYKKAADFIAEHGDETCDHCESRKRGPAKPRPRKDASPAAGPLQAGPPHTPGPYGYDFLTLLTEDFLTVLSAVDEDLMIKLLRAQTRDGGTVIDFLDAVMHGREDGFRVNHRISAARELISHILRDEHATAYAVLDNVGPVLSTVEGADPRVRPLPASHTPTPSTGKARGEGDSSPSPSTGEGWGEGDSPARPHTPPRGSVGAGFKPALPGAAWEPCNAESVVPAYPVVVPAEAGTQGSGGAGSATANSAHPELVLSDDQGPVPSAVKEPRIVRPELVEEPVLSLSEEQCSEDSVVPGSTMHGKPLGSERTEERKDKEPAPAELTPAERSIRQGLEAHSHGPDSWDRAIDPTTPGRSPPR